MMKIARLACALSLALCCAAAAQSTPEITGIWRISIDRKDGTTQYRYLDLTENGATVTGHVVSNYDSKDISAGTFANGKLHLEVHTWRDFVDVYDGSVQDGKLNLTMTTRQGGRTTRDRGTAFAVRDSGEGMKPPAAISVPELHDIADNGLVRTPPMGWNSWNHFAGKVSDATVRSAADALVSSGMKDAGYVYVNIDDTWEGERDQEGILHTNRKFPDMKALADYIHSKGLKLGIYSSPGPFTCAGYPGSFGHEVQDARTYASWGIDYLKYDWCSAGTIYQKTDLQPVYQKMGQALAESGRPVVYSLCEYGDGDVWTWGPQVGGNLWRTTGDIADNWKSLEEIGFRQIDIAQYASPGHWNDPDMLEVGNGGMTADEYRTHMTLWALLSAPLLAGNDLSHMSKDTLAILTNRDVIAIDQDSAVHHPKRTQLAGKTEAWTRQLANGSTVVAFFNREDSAATVSASWAQLGIDKTPAAAKNLWTGSPEHLSGESYRATVPKHGVVLLSLQ